MHRSASLGLPRGLPAASLKLEPTPRERIAEIESSAGITRGLIEAGYVRLRAMLLKRVFRGDYPRPH